ncbi:MAG: serine--tRNA ligase [Pseudomonadota bacterium]|nr:serine--tRNA ligase [Pseudomonadota bacterium]MDE3038440.1 serine--tRNA ligase [Pseudomonadota bacterium]
MHDIKFIRANPEAFDAAMEKRGLEPQSKEILELDAEDRHLQTSFQELQAKHNAIAKRIGMAKAKGEDITSTLQEAAYIKKELDEFAQNAAFEGVGGAEELLEKLPNIPAEDVPEGESEKDNKQIREWGKKPELSFKPKEHFDLGEALGLMDFESAAKISGSRFVVLKGALARMERALASFFLDMNTQAGYTEIVPPFLVRDNAVYGTGQLPKFGEDLFKTTDGYWLIPTAEVPLTNLVADSILDEEKLPLRFTAYTPCFRSEAGAAGKDTRGMIRQHQFSKVEMVSITHPDKSKEEHERMTACAEAILKKLGLHYRVMLLCTGDMGFSAEKTCDIEVWLPGQGAYREISSCSNCGAFQARRMKARFKPKGGQKNNKGGNEFVHTLNGSGLPIGRTMVAILENYQQENGTIAIPDALVPYMGGLKSIG